MAESSSDLAPDIIYVKEEQEKPYPQHLSYTRRTIVDRRGRTLCLSHGNKHRIQPYGTLFKSIIGYVDSFGHGLDGLEYSYDKFLYLKATYENSREPLILSLDKTLQQDSQQALNWQIKRLGASCGSLILIDLKSGNILAMANNYRDKKKSGNANLSLQKIINPWPIIYVISLKKYLEDHKEEVEATSKEKKKVDIIKTTKWHWHDISEKDSLWTKISENDIQNLKIPSNIMSTLVQLGFGQKTGIDLPDEVQGSLPFKIADNFEELITIPIKSTPIQTLLAFCRLISNNFDLTPKVVINKSLIKKNTSSNSNRLKSTTAQNNIFYNIIGDNFGPSVASFTQKDVNGHKRYEVLGLGFWPKKDPKIGYISVLFDAKKNPKQKRGTLGKMAHLAKKATKVLDFHYEFNPNKPLPLYALNKDITPTKLDKMPDLRGMSLRSAIEIINQIGITVKISGKGKVIKQYPYPGQSISTIKECTLVCER